MCNPDEENRDPTFCAPYPDYSVKKEVICFSGSETVEHESKGVISIQDIHIGDRILSADITGRFTKFSPVIAIPHKKNDMKAMFHEITTSSGAHIRMSPQHLLPVGPCHTTRGSDGGDNAGGGDDETIVDNNSTRNGYPLIYAVNAKIGDCVYNSKGEQEPIVGNDVVHGVGIYSVVTNEQLIVVNGIVASPFAVTHEWASFFYDMIFRFGYRISPEMMKLQWSLEMNHFLSNALIYFSTF